MTDPLRVRVCGPLELYARDFGAELLRLGYTRGMSRPLLNLVG